MKNMKRGILLLLLFPLAVFAQKQFTIEGNLSGIADKTLVFITDANNPADTLAKSTASGGKFALKGTLPEPGLYHINFADSKKKGLLFLDNSKVSLTGSAEDIQKIKVEGSLSHKDFEEFQSRF